MGDHEKADNLTTTTEAPVSPHSREPALLYLAVAAPLVQVVTAFVISDPALQGLVAAAIAAIAGVVTAWTVRSAQLVPLLVGAAQAVLAVAVGFGAPLTSLQQSAVLSAVGLIAAAWIRGVVTSPATAAAALTVSAGDAGVR